MNWPKSCLISSRSHVSGNPATIPEKASIGSDGQISVLDTSILHIQAAHIGEYLLGKDRAVLEQRIGYQPNAITAFKRWVYKNASTVYLSSILLLTILTFIAFALIGGLLGILSGDTLSSGSFLVGTPSSNGAGLVQWIVFFLFAAAMLVPALTIATSLVNWLITLTIQPRILPKLDFRNEIPDPFRTLVVIPALITSREEIDSLIHQLELHYLRNPEPGLLFGLLTDFRDADQETLPEDESLVQYATAAIEALK